MRVRLWDSSSIERSELHLRRRGCARMHASQVMGRIGLLGKELRFGIGKVLVQFHVGRERLIKVGFHLARNSV
jgi:hypothetical protein